MKRYIPPPPPDHGVEWNGCVKWPWFSARRRGYLLEQRVKDLEDEVAHMRRFLTAHDQANSQPPEVSR